MPPPLGRESPAVVLVGYSGHAWVVAESALRAGIRLRGYCDRASKAANPYGLTWFGDEQTAARDPSLAGSGWFVAIGDNAVRKRVMQSLEHVTSTNVRIVDPSTSLSAHAGLADGVFISARAVLNSGSRIGRGVIINTGAIVEHECLIGDFAHIAPGTILTGNVQVGEGAFVGAGAVVRPGIRIGAWARIGCGAVVVKDVPADTIVYGNPARPSGLDA